MEQIPKIMKRIHVPTYEEILSRITRRYDRVRGAKGRFYEVEARRVEQVYNIILAKLSFVDRLPSARRMPAFYAELAELAADGKYRKCLARLRHVPRILRSIYETYRYRILASADRREASRLRREAVGRMLSVIRREKCFRLVKEAVITLSRAPGISMDEPKVIIAGAPSSGKSTLLSRVSRARPEVAPYPFTTKNVLVGHVTRGQIRCQLIDTPGLLDRPLEERNEIEMKAILAIRHLTDSLIFLVDPTEDAYYSLEKQKSLLENTVLQVVGRDRVIVGINKVDAAGPARLEEAYRLFADEGYRGIHLVSAATGRGVDELVDDACSVAAENVSMRRG